MSHDLVRYAVVGLGRAGWNIHVAQLRSRADARIVAVADPVAQRRDEAKTEFGCQTYNHLDDLLRQDDIEVVVVATPSVFHASDTRKALQVGKHVVVEKPMATSIAEADDMIRAAQAAGRKLFVHQNYRFAREFTYMLDTVQSGVIGRLFHIKCQLINFARRNDWQSLAKNGGGVMNNTGPHFIDQALQLAGAPITHVMGDLQQIASAGDVEDHYKAFMRAQNGCTIDMEISSAMNVAMPAPRWVLCGSCGTLTIAADGKTATLRWFDPKQAPELVVVDGPATERKYGNADKLPWQETVGPAQGPDRGTFYDNVFGVLRQNQPMVVTPQSVREVIRVMALSRQGTAFPGDAAASPKLAPVTQA